MLPAAERSRLDELSRELEILKKKPPLEIPRAVVVQDGGPKGTRHEGFKDAQVFLRGNHKKLGKTVPRASRASWSAIGASDSGSPRGAAGCNWPTGWRAPTTL